MIKFALPVMLLAAAPAFAQAEVKPVAFERDGIRYQATVRTENGVTYISGKEVDTGRPFELKVANGRVIGRYAGSDVRYAAPAQN